MLTPVRDDLFTQDVAAISRIAAVPSLLQVICATTGMGFAAVARVTQDSWVACAVHDTIGVGLKAGDPLPIETTLCREARLARQPVVMDHVSQDPVYRNHPKPALNNFQSYISVPILRRDGVYFGNLCAIDREPAQASRPHILALFQLFAGLIALQLESEERHEASHSALETPRKTADLREHFIAVLGHDLRTPLAAVGASAEILRRGPDRAKTIEIGELLRSITRRMANLIDDVVDFTRGRLGGGISIAAENHNDLAVALRNVIDELRAVNPGREVIEIIEFGHSVRCDRGRVQQLLANLLGNAFTYGAADEPVVVKAVTEDKDLVLCVANGGTPIAPENLERVFEPYWRPATSKPGGGLGLGLYICCEIAKAHQGTLRAESSLEEGTRFIARLPLRGPT